MASLGRFFALVGSSSFLFRMGPSHNTCTVSAIAFAMLPRCFACLACLTLLKKATCALWSKKKSL